MRFPDPVRSPLPGFTPSGTLPEGDYHPGREDFEARFVHVPGSASRERIYAGWNRLREALLRSRRTGDERQLLDGSYTTTKPSPGDLDVAVEVRLSAEEYQQLILSKSHPVLEHLRGPASKAVYACDAYPIFVLPTNHPDYHSVSAKSIAYWMKWFGTGRDGTGKGRVWATNGGF